MKTLRAALLEILKGPDEEEKATGRGLRGRMRVANGVLGEKKRRGIWRMKGVIERKEMGRWRGPSEQTCAVPDGAVPYAADGCGTWSAEDATGVRSPENA